MMEYEEGGLSDQGGTVDPVSGNAVPPGALQEEVRDDIDAKLSEGEFVFPADVVRYIGLEKLMMMRQQAKQGLSMMEKMGQMSNADEAVMEDTAPAAVFDIPDDMDMPAVMVAELEMAEGGDVQGEKRYKSFRELMGTDGDTAEIVTYVNEAGRKIIIMHMNGAPVSQVPEGFYPEGSDPPADDDGTDDGTTPPADPPAPPQVQQQQEESGDEPPVQSGAVITTGGFIDKGRVIGGDQWNVSYNLDGSVKLSNPTHGDVTLSKDEASGLGVGGITNPKAGLAAALTAFTPSGVEKGRQRQQQLSSGEVGDPTKGNEIHKALVEKAQLQTMGKQFIEAGASKMSATDMVRDAFGLGQTNDLEGAIANALGKTSADFNDTDLQIIGAALSGVPNSYSLPTSDPDFGSKVQKVQALVDELSKTEMQMPTSKPSREDRGLKTPTISQMTTDPGGNGDDGPPVFRLQPEDPANDGGGPNINTSPVSGTDQSGGETTGDVAGSVGNYDGDDSDDEGTSTGNSYSIGSGAPVDAFNERPGLGSSSNNASSSYSSSFGSGGGYYDNIGPSFNKGSLVKKRRGLASR